MNTKSKTEFYWQFTDARGVVCTGQMERHIDRGHNDCTAIMRTDEGATVCVSGSRLKTMVRLSREVPTEPTEGADQGARLGRSGAPLTDELRTRAGRDLKAQLRDQLAAHGLDTVLEALVEVVYARAEELRGAPGRDEDLWRVWIFASAAIGGAASRIRTENHDRALEG